MRSAVVSSCKKDDATQEELLRAPCLDPIRPEERPPRDQDPRPGLRQRALPALLLRSAAGHLRGSLRRPRPGIGACRPTTRRRTTCGGLLPGLILRHNLHGIDIDLRAVQIAGLALWLRCQRAYQEMGLKKDRPPITKSNIVCAEPMPGEKELLDEFLKTLRDDHLEALIRQVMQVPEGTRVRATQGDGRQPVRPGPHRLGEDAVGGRGGRLLKIEEELQDAIRRGQEEWEEKQPLFRFTEFSLTEPRRNPTSASSRRGSDLLAASRGPCHGGTSGLRRLRFGW